MIKFEKHTLNNGLKVILHEDRSTPLAFVNVLYEVGSKNEEEDKTGFAHLFEHLMFGGSVNIPSFDQPLQKAGGENNAFTNQDYTNYYEYLPAENLETALWLESDRMLSLDFSQHSLDVQRKVVVEEFKEHYINQPYGDVWHKLLDLSFQKHNYKWPTIGRETSHIENAVLQDVKDFFFKYYRPNNAILCVAGDIDPKKTLELIKKWFDEIEPAQIHKTIPSKEEKQKGARMLEVESNVPLDSIYKAYHMPERNSQGYYVADLISDLLSSGDSSRFNKNLIKGKQKFSELNAYVSGNIDEGLFIIEGKPNEGVSLEEANLLIEDEISKLIQENVNDRELKKVQNKVESYLTLSEVNVRNKALSLCVFEMMGDANKINFEIDSYLNVNPKDIRALSTTLFDQDNSNTLLYKSKPN